MYILPDMAGIGCACYNTRNAFCLNNFIGYKEKIYNFF